MKKFVALFGLVLTVLATSAFAGNTLEQDQQLQAGEELTSDNGSYSLRMQQDGNLVLYKNSNNEALWATYTQGNSGARAVMQYDGNLVVYTATSGVLWASYTQFNSNAKLVIQNDGNLVIYKTGGTPVWWTDTVQKVCTVKNIDHWGGVVTDGTTQLGGYSCTVYAPLLPQPGPHYEPYGNDLCVFYPPYAGKFPVEICE